jgi:hypothetical protein
MTTDFRFVGWGLASHVTQHAALWHATTKRRRRAPPPRFCFSFARSTRARRQFAALLKLPTGFLGFVARRGSEISYH